ncbi:MAG: hypothetical protein KDK04_00375 [Candidatus Competibacteraceae bacterium]|nr:hypothetical protein [Candidatus Competibacteraceae bacterium]MCB1803734.1 hypothetical protein [Candidatus Competibacteraceae bacterium]MCB1810169.1 hypothetical protein [Candidatus Competibacteraceae bacterium]
MSQTEKKVIEFYTPEGEVKPYCPLSARLPAFLAQYGPETGYALLTEIQDALSLKPGLLRLYEVAIQAGQKPQDMGLPSPALIGQMQVCRASLQDVHGRVVATATASKHVQVYKDLETLETAARQRLLAALGYGGDVFDVDEGHDQSDLGLSPMPDPTIFQPAAEDSASAATSACNTESAATSVVAHRPAEPVTTSSAQLVMLRRQIAHLADTRGIEVPPVASVDEARSVLKSLLQVQAS